MWFQFRYNKYLAFYPIKTLTSAIIPANLFDNLDPPKSLNIFNKSIIQQIQQVCILNELERSLGLYYLRPDKKLEFIVSGHFREFQTELIIKIYEILNL